MDYRDPQRRGSVGTIQKRYGVAEYMAFEILFADGQTELFWDHQLEEAKESALRSKLREVLYTIHTNGASAYGHGCKVVGYLIGRFREGCFSDSR